MSCYNHSCKVLKHFETFVLYSYFSNVLCRSNFVQLRIVKVKTVSLGPVQTAPLQQKGIQPVAVFPSYHSPFLGLS